jgi:Uroporphyrinogen decarboxylase (URO-D)
MIRQFYLDLAAHGLRMPIGADLVMHEESDPETVRNNGQALGRVIGKTARRWGTPLAIPLMDLRLEKTDLLAMAGVSATEAEAFHFTSPLDETVLATLCGEQTAALCAGSIARDQALAYIGTQPDLVSVGMAIGPFSLITRLMADPITATALSGSGIEAEDSDEVKLLWQCLRVSEAAVLRSMRSQIRHGAKAIMICEPTACSAFISPRQLKAGSNLFERLVMEPNLRLKAALTEAGCDLIFHDCGELIDPMVEAFAQRLHPVILSLGSSRKLWQDAHLVPKDVVLYGNLPTKSFYSDGAMPVEEVIRRTDELVANMKACGHPHIVGSECDVLFVADAQETIGKKVDAMMTGAAMHTDGSLSAGA